MTALAITATQVLPDNAGTIKNGIAGVAITAGQAVYLDTTTSTYKLAQCDGTAAEAVIGGVALNGAAAGQPIAVQSVGSPILGAAAAPAVGTVYALGAVAGTIVPIADIASTNRVSILGVGAAVPANGIKLGINNTLQVVP